jgi:hypothetical protein
MRNWPHELPTQSPDGAQKAGDAALCESGSALQRVTFERRAAVVQPFAR